MVQHDLLNAGIGSRRLYCRTTPLYHEPSDRSVRGRSAEILFSFDYHQKPWVLISQSDKAPRDPRLPKSSWPALTRSCGARPKAASVTGNEWSISDMAVGRAHV